MSVLEFLERASTLPPRDVRPADYLGDGPNASHANLERLFHEARRDGYSLRLILTQEDLIDPLDRDSLDVHRYRTGVQAALFRASTVVIVMRDGRRWVHKSMEGPQGCFEKQP